MNARDLQLLESAEGSPSLSIYLPLQVGTPQKKLDELRIRTIREHLAKELASSPHAASLIEYVVSSLTAHRPKEHTKTVALFVSPTIKKIVALPVLLPETIHVSDEFYVQPLLQAQKISKPYWVLELNPSMTRLYHAVCGTLIEMQDPKKDPMGIPHEGFPLAYVYEDKTFERMKLAHDKVASYDDAHKRTFLKRVDHVLADHLMREPLPLVLIGDVENRAFFMKVTHHGQHVIAQVDGDFAPAQHNLLEERVWDAVQKARRAEEEKVTGLLDEAVGRNHAALGLHAVRRMAQEGRVHRLFIEEGYSVIDALVSETASQGTDQHGPAQEGQDIMNKIIEEVIKKGGSVDIVSHNVLKNFQHIAALLRY